MKKITQENKREYVKLLIRARLCDKVRPMVSAKQVNR